MLPQFLKQKKYVNNTGLVKSYIYDCRGNFAIILSIVLPLLLFGMAIAIDIAKLESNKVKMQNSLDSSLLAHVVQFMNTGRDDPASATATMNENYINNATITMERVEKVGNEYVAKGSASGQHETLVMDIFGKDNLAVSVTSEVRVKIRSISAALVTDISWSMEGTPLTSTKRALEKFGEEIYTIPQDFRQRLRLSYVPYAGSVNLTGVRNANELLTHWSYNADTNEPVNRRHFYQDGNLCDGRFELHTMVPQLQGNDARILTRIERWKNIIVGQRNETRYRMENQRQADGTIRSVSVPYTVLAPEWGMRCVFENESPQPWSGCVQSDQSEFDPSLVVGRGSRAPMPASISLSRGAPHCPADNTSMRVNIQSQHELRNHVRQNGIGFGTNHDIGLLWGARSLEPNWSGFLNSENRPWNEEDFPKFMIFLSDGISSPVNYFFGNYPQRTEGLVDQNAQRVCDYLKDQGVTIYGISYSPNSSTVDIVKDCSSPKKHYHASNTSIEDVMVSIAKDIKNAGMRISN